MKAMFFCLFLCWGFAYGDDSILRGLGLDRIPEKRFLVAIDFDDTIVDTEGILVNWVIPQVVQAYPQKELFFPFLASIRQRYPFAYTSEHWAEHEFPLDEVSLEDFWKSMRRVFQSSQRPDLKVFPFAQELARAVEREYFSSLRWVVLTARSGALLDEVRRVGQRVFEAPIQVIGRGRPGRNSVENAQFKEKVLAFLNQDVANPVVAFFDNDPEVIRFIESSVDSISLYEVLPYPRTANFHPICAHFLRR